MTPIPVAILGAGGFAREVWWALGEARTADGRHGFRPVLFVDRERRPAPLKGLPVVTLEDVPPGVRLVCGIGGMTDLKARVVGEALAAGRPFAPAVIAAGAQVGPDVTIGEGTILCAGTIVTTDVTIGAHVAINLDCTIGHDAVIGDFVTASPGCHVSGGVSVGALAYLGTGAVILEQVRIGARAVLGAGAVATKDIPDDVVAVGIPATVRKSR